MPPLACMDWWHHMLLRRTTWPQEGCGTWPLRGVVGQQRKLLGGTWACLIVRGSTTTLSIGDLVSFSTRIEIPGLLVRKVTAISCSRKLLGIFDSLLLPEGTIGKVGLQACHQIVQRPEPIGSTLGGCLISWCIISGCLLCQFTTGATPSSQFQGALLKPQDSYGNFHRFTDKCCLYHFDRPNHHSLILYLYYASHSHRY